MLSVVSQPIVHSHYDSQQNLAESNQHANDLENHDKDGVKTEETKLTQKANKELSQTEQQEIAQLKQRDLEVKAHEQAHLSAAGSLAIGGATFTYQTGPNGVRYAVGGEVGIDTSPVNGDPAATLKKADTIRRAALAPANPSNQDQLVASKATSMAGKAQADLAKLSQEMKQEKQQGLSGNDKSDIERKGRPELNNEQKKTSAQGSLLDISI